MIVGIVLRLHFQRMHRIFAVIKKKKNVGRIAALFLALVLLELFSHALLDEHAHSSGHNSPTSLVVVSIKSESNLNETFVTLPGDQGGNTEQPFLNDQTLHHDVLISSIFSPAKKATYRNERIVSYFDGMMDTPLSPPYLPPQTS